MGAVDARRFPAVRIRLKDRREVTLRVLDARDESALGDFYESVPREDYRFYRCRQLDRALARDVAAKAESACDVVLIAEETETKTMVGYAWFNWPEAAPEKSIFGICIRRTHQGDGLGRRLMTRLLAIAREVGPPIMTLTVQVANPRALKLYQSMGFRVVRRQMRNAMPDFPSEPEYYMEKTVR